MKYKLIPNSNSGVIIDRTPILQDVRDTFEVSFLLPNDSPYIALFSGADGVEYRKVIKDGICKIPKELLAREQYVDLTVCQFDGDNVLHAWQCEPLKITAFFGLRRSQWQISGGMTEDDCYKRLVVLEEIHAQTLGNFKKLTDDFKDLKASTEDIKKDADKLLKQNKELAEEFVKQAKAIKIMIQDIKALKDEPLI